MLYVRALKSDFVKWNVSGWTWAEAFEIYKVLEKYVSASNTTAVPDYHGTAGPIHTTAADYIDQLAPLFISSAVQDGIPLTSDFNNPDGTNSQLLIFD
jgi:choline dehydrogenase